MGGTYHAGRGGRWAFALALLTLCCAGWVGTARADEAAKELTQEERLKLAEDALELNEEALRIRQGGQYAKAIELLEKSLAIYRRLYPPDKYPDGHPNLAISLCNLGAMLEEHGEYAKAEPYYRDALDTFKRLYPPDKYPDGQPDLALTLGNLGELLEEQGEYAKAEPFFRDALDMRKKLYPPAKYPDGHADLATSLNNMGFLLQARGEYGRAEPYFRDALAMCKRLYPPAKYPDGHPELAVSLNNLGALLQDRAEYGEAEPYYRDALNMRKRLYPPEKYPDGHPDLARSLNNLGVLLEYRKEVGEAEPYLRFALDMRKHLYPPDTFPDGHPDLAQSLNNLAGVLVIGGKPREAEPYYRDALDMNKRLYPPAKYPDGHPDLARSLNNLAGQLHMQGKYDEAEPYYRDALDMYKRLYPPAKYPDGHPDLAMSLDTLGLLLHDRGKNALAVDALVKGTAMSDRLAAAFADRAAEAEDLNFPVSLPSARGVLLAATARLEGADPAAVYPVLWGGRAGIARALERRRRLLRAAGAADATTRGKLETLRQVRADLARLVLAPTRPGDADRDQLLQALTDRKERLEKELAAALPPSDRETPPYTELAERLPEQAAFVDLYRYADWDPKPRKVDDERYAAFVLRRGRPIRRVELNDGAAIDKDLARWRQDTDKGFAGDAAGRLRQSVWEPLAKALGDGVDTVFLCPDGDLAALPWSALSGDRPGSVLLEDYTFATVPSGLFLLEQLTRPVLADRDAGLLLAVGGVPYDRAGAPADQAGKPWPALPATDKERAAVAAQARRRAKAPEVIDRTGDDADVAHLLQDLPRARWAHLATHGFFAAKDTQEREHLFRPDDFAFGFTALGDRLDRRGAAARNPLTESGLVLAGANQPTDQDTGLLTGEAIAGLDLDGMDLAVLSACETGLGEAAQGEGVFGLQRAFHIAGAKNVVASLWRVDDESARALMNVFYAHLWGKGEPPLEALRHAQLDLYRNPDAVPNLAKGSRSPDWDATFQAVTRPPADPQAPPTRPAAVKDWAAFVLSGAGR